MVAYQQGDYGRAAGLVHESLLLGRDIGSRALIEQALELLAWVASAWGQPRRAARLGGAVEALREAQGVPVASDWQAGHEQAVRAMRAALGEEAFAAAWAEGRALSPEDAVALALEDTDAVPRGL
jgi:hypothetical protein